MVTISPLLCSIKTLKFWITKNKNKKNLGPQQPWLPHALYKPQIAPSHQPEPLISFHEIQMLKASTTTQKSEILKSNKRHQFEKLF